MIFTFKFSFFGSRMDTYNFWYTVATCYLLLVDFYILVRDIEHLGGEGIKSTETNGVMNTLLDFYLMSYSNTIVSISVYGHVSGFSKYCSVIYGIPFKFIKI